MNDPTPDIDDIFEIVQNEFDGIDQKLGSRRKRLMAIGELPQLERDLYLVHDIVAITCNAGTGAWIHYHHDEPGWITFASEAFARIGHPQVGEGLGSCLAIYLSNRDAMTSKDDRIPSDYIVDHEHEIMRSFYAYLLKNGYEFRSPED